MSWRGWQVLVVVLVTAVLTAGASLVSALRVSRDTERRLCGIVVAQDEAYREQQPTTAAGRNVARAWTTLRRDFHCP